MILIRELRFDNWVHSICHNARDQIRGIVVDKIHLNLNPLARYNENDLEPIELTSTILMASQVKWTLDGCYQITPEVVMYSSDMEFIKGYQMYSLDVVGDIAPFGRRIVYVHEFQNIYLDLTGEVVEIKFKET